MREVDLVNASTAECVEDFPVDFNRLIASVVEEIFGTGKERRVCQTCIP